jgi:acetyltransferase-like isoleucine patch superfamily enzyme
MATGEVSAWKILYWELRDFYGQFMYLSWFLRSIPGEFGIRARGRLLRKYFGSCGSGVIIHPGVKFRNVQNLFVGDNVHIGEDAHIQAGGGVEIGNNVMLGPGIKIWSQNHEFGPVGPVNDQDYQYRKVIIEDDGWIGANAFIMPGVHLPIGSIVVAGSVVGVKIYPPYAVIGGNPARVVKLRQE